MKIIASRYQISEKIGSGSFGDVYMGEHIVTHDRVAIKLEDPKKSKQLETEAKLYNLLQGFPGVPKIHWEGREGDFNILVLDLLGKSLEDYLQEMKKLSLKTVLMIADQMISLVQYIHERNYIHRDIKPMNFLFGKEKNNKGTLYMIDYGLANKYIKKEKHIPYREDHEALIGTARYVSINAHLGIEQSRRDDMECVGYTLIYLLKGRLPWQGIQCENLQEKFRKIAEEKMKTSYEALCDNLPHEFIDFFKIVRNLGFDERPPYEKLRAMFRRLFINQKYIFDLKYDWSKQVMVRPLSMSTMKIHSPLFDENEVGLVSHQSEMNQRQARLPPLIRKPLSQARQSISFSKRKVIQHNDFRSSMPFAKLGVDLAIMKLHSTLEGRK